MKQNETKKLYKLERWRHITFQAFYAKVT